MKKLNRVGEKYTTNQGYIVEIVEYFNSLNITLKFEDGTLIYNIRFGNLKRGNVSHPLRKSVFGVGYIGIGKYKSTENGRETVSYSRWSNMLSRCYSKKNLNNSLSVCEEWHNYQNFGAWFDENWDDVMNTSWHLDKDIRIKGNKIYSPSACMFVPKVINNLFIRTTNKDIASTVEKSSGIFTPYLSKNKKTKGLGRYKNQKESYECYKYAKEGWIKEIADEWKERLRISTYNEITQYKI